jgi:sarcosine oxidase
MSEEYDAIVIGVGGMGSATLFECARRGLDVLGIEQFDIPHKLGSSHGLTRIIRLAYFESPAYVPLLVRAYELWDELQQGVGEQLLFKTGSIDAGWESSESVQGSLRSCRQYSLRHDVLDAREVSRRFPGYSLAPGMLAVVQPDGGILLPERCVASYVSMAQRHGAVVHTRERVSGWEAAGDRVTVRTSSGAVYRSKHLVITAGPWARSLVPALNALAVPERQVVLWTGVEERELFMPDRFPVFNLQASDDDSERYYGFPLLAGPGFKIGKFHHRQESGNPEDLSREIDAVDEEVIRQAIRRFFPKANGPTLASETCLFTNSPDGHFILDTHPDAAAVFIAAGFSGHGFKFCGVVGEIMADLVTRGDSRHDVSQFRLRRQFPVPPRVSE